MSAESKKTDMALTINPPQIKIYGEKDFWVNGLIKESNLSSLIPFYLDILTNLNTFIKYEVIEKIFSNMIFNFYIDKNNNIHINSISTLKQQFKTIDTQQFKLLPKEHFWVSGLKRSFDLSVLIQLYLHVVKNCETLTKCVKEISIGSSTIVFQLDDDKNIYLITGWMGNRKKK